MKKVIVLLLYFFCCTSFAFAPTPDNTFSSPSVCQAVNPWPATNVDVFCGQFEEAAYCHCGQVFPGHYDWCKNILTMSGIYKKMLDMYKTVEGACKHDHGEVDEPTCIAQWKFYLASCRMP
jgi:hypothetical protein